MYVCSRAAAAAAAAQCRPCMSFRCHCKERRRPAQTVCVRMYVCMCVPPSACTWCLDEQASRLTVEQNLRRRQHDHAAYAMGKGDAGYLALPLHIYKARGSFVVFIRARQYRRPRMRHSESERLFEPHCKGATNRDQVAGNVVRSSQGDDHGSQKASFRPQ